MTSKTPEKDPLRQEETNEEAITTIMELYNVDIETATELWRLFIGTVRKMRELGAKQE